MLLTPAGLGAAAAKAAIDRTTADFITKNESVVFTWFELTRIGCDEEKLHLIYTNSFASYILTEPLHALFASAGKRPRLSMKTSTALRLLVSASALSGDIPYGNLQLSRFC